MKKLLSFVTLISFGMTWAGVPFVEAAQTQPSFVPVAVQDSLNPVIATDGSSIRISSFGTTTWQKGFDQTVNVNVSSNVSSAISQAVSQAVKDVTGKAAALIATAQPSARIAIYLVPVATSTSAGYSSQQSKDSPSFSLSLNSSPISIPSFNPYLASPSMSSSFAGPTFNPSYALYVPSPASAGYFVGYVSPYTSTTNVPSSNLPSWAGSGFSTSTISSFSIGDLPLGSYRVYAALGVASVVSTSTVLSFSNNAPTSSSHPVTSPYSFFPILLPDIAASNEQLAFIPADATPSTPVKNQPQYSTKLAPLPQSAKRNIVITTTGGSVRYPTTSKTSGVEYDTVLSSFASNTVSITPAPDPIIVITSPDYGDAWQKGVTNKVNWLTNFKLGKNNTGLDKNNGLTIVPVYGYNFLHPHRTGGNPLSDIETRAILAVVGLIPVVGIIVNIVYEILDVLGALNGNSAPIAVPTKFTLIPTQATLAACNAVASSSASKTSCESSYNLGSTYLENATINIAAGKIKSVFPGDYEIVASARFNNNKPAIMATSSVFSILPGQLSISSISLLTTTSGVQARISGSEFTIGDDNTVVFSDIASQNTVTGIAPSTDGMSIILQSLPLDLKAAYKVKVINNYGTSTSFLFTPSKSLSTSTIVSTTTPPPVSTTTATSTVTTSSTTISTVPAVVSYGCAQGAVLSGQICLTTVVGTSSKTVNPIVTSACPVGTTQSSSRPNKCMQTGTTTLSDMIKTSTCPAGSIYSLAHNGNQVRCYEIATSSTVSPATATYSCPTNFTLNSSSKTCSQVVQTQSANVWGSVIDWITSWWR